MPGRGTDPIEPTKHPDRREVEILRHMFDYPDLTHGERAQYFRHMNGDLMQKFFAKAKANGWIRTATDSSIDLQSLGYVVRYRVEVWVNPQSLYREQGGMPGDMGINSQRSLADYIIRKLAVRGEFKDEILVEEVRIQLGSEADLSLTLRAKAPEHILRFVTEGLRRCGGISQTASYLEAYTLRYQPPDLPKP